MKKLTLKSIAAKVCIAAMLGLSVFFVIRTWLENGSNAGIFLALFLIIVWSGGVWAFTTEE